MLLRLYILVFTVISFCSNGQNLLQDGDFEQTDSNSCFGSTVPPAWQQIHTADTFDSICPIGSGYTCLNNSFGTQAPKSGKAYIGICTFIFGTPYREYVYQQLQSPLDAGATYCMSFYISKAEKPLYAISGIEVAFSTITPTLNGASLNVVPQITSGSSFLVDTINWVKISGNYIAHGGESYVTIGHISSNPDTFQVGSLSPLPIQTGKSSYYYIDSVTLYQCVPPLPDSIIQNANVNIPNIFTPNEDGVNDTFSITLPPSYSLNEGVIYNRWGNLIYQPERKGNTIILWDGRTNSGEKCSEGIYYYVLEYTDGKGEIQKKKGYISLFR